jgi:hypothetical protein
MSTPRVIPLTTKFFYGTEVGLTQELDVHQGDKDVHKESRTPMLWGV